MMIHRGGEARRRAGADARRNREEFHFNLGFAIDVLTAGRREIQRYLIRMCCGAHEHRRQTPRRSESSAPLLRNTLTCTSDQAHEAQHR